MFKYLVVVAACFGVAALAADAAVCDPAIYNLDSSTCLSEYTTCIFGGQTHYVGNLTAAVRDNKLTISVSSVCWSFRTVHFFAGSRATWDAKFGTSAPSPGQFPYQTSKAALTTQIWQEEIDLSKLGTANDINCDSESIIVAVHFEAEHHCNTESCCADGRSLGGQTAWAYDRDNRFPSNRWGWFIEFSPKCTCSTPPPTTTTTVIQPPDEVPINKQVCCTQCIANPAPPPTPAPTTTDVVSAGTPSKKKRAAFAVSASADGACTSSRGELMRKGRSAPGANLPLVPQCNETVGDVLVNERDRRKREASPAAADAKLKLAVAAAQANKEKNNGQLPQQAQSAIARAQQLVGKVCAGDALSTAEQSEANTLAAQIDESLVAGGDSDVPSCTRRAVQQAVRTDEPQAVMPDSVFTANGEPVCACVCPPPGETEIVMPCADVVPTTIAVGEGDRQTFVAPTDARTRCLLECTDATTGQDSFAVFTQAEVAAGIVGEAGNCRLLCPTATADCAPPPPATGCENIVSVECCPATTDEQSRTWSQLVGDGTGKVCPADTVASTNEIVCCCALTNTCPPPPAAEPRALATMERVAAAAEDTVDSAAVTGVALLMNGLVLVCALMF